MGRPEVIVGFAPGVERHLGAPGHGAAAELVEYGRALEGVGVESVLLDGRAPSPDPLVVLGALAARTETLRLGARLALPGGRPASVVAKHVSGLDVCAEGRAWLCIEESAAPVFGFDAAAARGRLAESLDVLRALVRVTAPSLHGRYEQLRDAWNEPRWPHDEGGLRLGLVVATAAPDLEERLELSARVADAVLLVPAAGAPSLATCRERLEAAGRRAGRPPGAIVVLGALALALDEGEPRLAPDTARVALDAGLAGVVLDIESARPSPAMIGDFVEALS